MSNSAYATVEFAVASVAT